MKHPRTKYGDTILAARRDAVTSLIDSLEAGLDPPEGAVESGFFNSSIKPSRLLSSFQEKYPVGMEMPMPTRGGFVKGGCSKIKKPI